MENEIGQMFLRVWTDLDGGLHAPLWFRLVFQPLGASILGVRAGLRDARAGRPPFLRYTRLDRSLSRELRGVWRDLARLFVLAVLADVIYQILMVRWVYPSEALLVAAILVLVPYSLIRGPTNRIARRFARS